MTRSLSSSALVLAGLAIGCAPSYAHLLQSRRYADALCLASSEEEAKAAAIALERDAAPRIHLHAVNERELAPVIGDRSKEALTRALLLRTKTACNKLSLSQLSLNVGFWEKQPHDPGAMGKSVGALSSWNNESYQAIFGVTGERAPSSSQLSGKWLLMSFLTFGLGALTGDAITPMYESVPVSEEQYAKAGPMAAGIVEALTSGSGTEGYVIGKGDQAVETHVSLRASDWLNGGGQCELSIWTDLALPSMRPGVQGEIARVFGARMRRLEELPVKERSYSLSNKIGHWSGTL